MDNNKKYHVGLEDITAWNDMLKDFPTMLEIMKLVYNRLLLDKFIAADTLFDVFRAGGVDVGTVGVPFTHIGVGAVTIDGPFDKIFIFNDKDVMFGA